MMVLTAFEVFCAEEEKEAQLLRKNKLNTYPVFVLIFSKDFVEIGDGYMKRAMNMLNILLRKQNPWLYRTF